MLCGGGLIGRWEQAALCTLPLCYFTALPLYRFTALPLYRFTALPLYRFTALPLYRFTALPLYRFTALPLYRFTALPLYRFTAFTALPLYRFTALPLYRFTALPLYLNCAVIHSTKFLKSQYLKHQIFQLWLLLVYLSISLLFLFFKNKKAFLRVVCIFITTYRESFTFFKNFFYWIFFCTKIIYIHNLCYFIWTSSSKAQIYILQQAGLQLLPAYIIRIVFCLNKALKSSDMRFAAKQLEQLHCVKSELVLSTLFRQKYLSLFCYLQKIIQPYIHYGTILHIRQQTTL